MRRHSFGHDAPGLGVRPKFISGEFRIGPSGLQVDPIAVVFERNGVREMVQPWVDAGGASDGAEHAHAPTTALAPTSPTAAVLDDVLDALADIYGIGLTRVDNAHVRTWRDLSSRASATGLDRIAAMVECVASRLDTKASAVDWDANPVAQAIVDLTVVTRVAVDLL